MFATPSTATIIDQHDFTGDIQTLIEEAEKYILKNIRIGMTLEGLVRVDIPEIDRAAFREAIINAFCHRDYRDPDEVRIAVFPDRVEVRNPGTLMEGSHCAPSVPPGCPAVAIPSSPISSAASSSSRPEAAASRSSSTKPLTSASPKSLASSSPSFPGPKPPRRLWRSQLKSQVKSRNCSACSRQVLLVG